MSHWISLIPVEVGCCNRGVIDIVIVVAITLMHFFLFLLAFGIGHNLQRHTKNAFECDVCRPPCISVCVSV